MMKRILWITTGGTIASMPSDDGLVPQLTSQELLGLFGGIDGDYEVQAYDLFDLDSSNIQPEEWRMIAQCIADKYRDYDGIVLTHGTDTMAYTASMLSYLLRDLPVPVVFTGSQMPIQEPLSDAMGNLRCAFAMATSGVPGVYVAFDRKIILGTRAVKVRTTAFDAFESVNCPCAAVVNAKGLQLEVIPRRPRIPFRQVDPFCDRVFLIKLIPGFDPKVFDMLLQMDYKGVVIEAFGAGGLHFIRRDLISQLEKLVDHGVAVVVCSQCLYERCDFSLYQTGRKALEKGVIQTYDMTTEAVVTKLMWALGVSDSLTQVREMFATDYVGEVTL